MEGLTITGNTPFEKAQVGRAKTQLLLVTHFATREIVREIDQCDEMIAQWKETVAMYSNGKATKEDLEADLLLATQALKDKKVFEEALIKICETAGEELGLEA